jgi:hypothetical protein
MIINYVRLDPLGRGYIGNHLMVQSSSKSDMVTSMYNLDLRSHRWTSHHVDGSSCEPVVVSTCEPTDGSRCEPMGG